MKHSYTIKRGALDGFDAFLAVARFASFRRAAAELGVTPSAMSQTIRAPESRLGVALFARTTRSVGLTEAGQCLLERARPAFDELLVAAQAARELGSGPVGHLRLAVPRAALPLLVQPVLASFCAAYPGVELEISASEELVDLANAGFDAGIRMGQFIDADMVAVRLTPPFRFVVAGSPAYLARQGRPQVPEDLRQHACLRLRRSSGALAPWRLMVDGLALDVDVSGPLIANEFPTLMSAALDGIGLVQAPAPLVDAHTPYGALARVLEAQAPMTPGMFLYYPGRRQVLPKLRAFIDHVRGALASE